MYIKYTSFFPSEKSYPIASQLSSSTPNHRQLLLSAVRSNLLLLSLPIFLSSLLPLEPMKKPSRFFLQQWLLSRGLHPGQPSCSPDPQQEVQHGCCAWTPSLMCCSKLTVALDSFRSASCKATLQPTVDSFCSRGDHSVLLFYRRHRVCDCTLMIECRYISLASRSEPRG